MRETNKIWQNIVVSDTGSEGHSVGRHGDIVVFIEGAIPGDVVDVEVKKKKSNYAEAKVVAFHQYSSKREKPVCTHFGTCGGCKWQNMNYESQLFYKEKQVADALKRVGKIELPEIQPIISSAKKYHYRNKLEFTFSNKKWLTWDQINSGQEFERNALGFHIPKMFDKILDIDECFLQEEPSNSIRLEVKKYALENNLSFFDMREQVGFLRTLIIRTSSTGEVMTIFTFHNEDKENREKLLEHISKKFPQITSLMYVINPKRNDTISDLDIQLYKGNPYIFEQMEGLKFKIGPKSFYQTNSEQAYELYKVARNYAELKGDELVYDLYTGTGTIANFVARQAKKVIGVEYISAAIEDAKENSKENKISNTLFFAGDMKDVLNDEFIKQNGKPDVTITDPPRAGMHEDVVKKIIEIAPKTVVYVSCNPATQARDIALMDATYKVTAIQPVDMFPHTHHVENVVKLERRN